MTLKTANEIPIVFINCFFSYASSMRGTTWVRGGAGFFSGVDLISGSGDFASPKGTGEVYRFGLIIRNVAYSIQKNPLRDLLI